MEEYNKGAWEELIERCEESGVDAFEINFSCPHGMPERKMGMAMGQDPEILQVRLCPHTIHTAYMCVRCMLAESHWCTCSLSDANMVHVVHTLHAEHACTVSVVQCFTSHTSFTVVITVDNIVVVTVITLCVQEVCGWINEKVSIPVWAKMTPNITDITFPARTALNAGCEGVAAINTIQSVMGVNLKTLRPEPSVEGYSTPGGYSSVAVKPIALAKVNCCVRCTACVHACALQASFLLGAASFLAQKFTSARFAKRFV